MKENSFLQELGKRAQENKKIRESTFSSFLIYSVGIHPWKYIIPISVFVTLLFTLALRQSYIDRVLWLFGSIPSLR